MDPLLERAARGDEAARNELVRRFEDDVRHHVEHELGARLRRQVSIADVCQETFARVIRTLDSLPADATLAVFRSRLFQNSEWMIVQFARRGKHFAGESELPSFETPDDRRNITGAVTQGEELEKLRLLAERLPEKYREVLRLRLEGQAFAEIGRALGLTEATARKRYERAYTQLRAAITERFPDRAS